MGIIFSKKERMLVMSGSAIFFTASLFQFYKMYNRYNLHKDPPILESEPLIESISNKPKHQSPKSYEIEKNKDKEYENQIQNIRNLFQTINSSLDQSNFENRKTILIKINNLASNLYIKYMIDNYVIERKERRLARGEILNYLNITKTQIQNNEKFSDFCLREVLKDSKILQRNYDSEYRILFNKFPSEFIQETLRIEQRKLLALPDRKKFLEVEDIKKYFSMKIEKLEEFNKDKELINNLKRFPSNLISNIINSYITDEIAIKLDIEIEDFMKRADFTQNPDVCFKSAKYKSDLSSTIQKISS